MPSSLGSPRRPPSAWRRSRQAPRRQILSALQSSNIAGVSAVYTETFCENDSFAVTGNYQAGTETITESGSRGHSLTYSDSVYSANESSTESFTQTNVSDTETESAS